MNWNALGFLIIFIVLCELTVSVLVEDKRERQDRELIASLVQNQKAEADILMRSAGK